jgi:hypothetical protein
MAIVSGILMVGFLILTVISPKNGLLTKACAMYFGAHAAASYLVSKRGRTGVLVSQSMISVIRSGPSFEIIPVSRIAGVVPRFLDGRVLLFDAAGNRIMSLPTGSFFRARRVCSTIKDVLTDAME